MYSKHCRRPPRDPRHTQNRFKLNTHTYRNLMYDQAQVDNEKCLVTAKNTIEKVLSMQITVYLPLKEQRASFIFALNIKRILNAHTAVPLTKCPRMSSVVFENVIATILHIVSY